MLVFSRNKECLTNKTKHLAVVLVNTVLPMSDSPPTPPADLPDDAVTLLDEYSAARLQQVPSMPRRSRRLVPATTVR
jgi:hypothetical protein